MTKTFRKDWIITISGIEFNLRDPQPEMINLSDITHSLSITNRYIIRLLNIFADVATWCR